MSLEALIEQTATKQDAVLWPYQGTGKYGGASYGDPEEIKVRWSTQSKKLTDDDGVEFVSRARVLMRKDASRRDRLYLGTKADLTAAEKSDPTLANSYEIRMMDRRTRLGGTKFIIFEAWL